MQHYEEGEIINVGAGYDLTIAELAGLIAEVVAFPGKVVFDPSYPDGTPKKLLDVSRISQVGWRPRTDLREGLFQTYAWFVQSDWSEAKTPPII